MQEECYHKIYLNEERHWWLRSKIDIIRELLKKYGGMGGAKVLDAGCGTSFLSKSIFNDLGKVYNVDNFPLSLEYSRRRGMINVINSDLNKLPFPDGFFDVGICMDVIEHNQDDQGLVCELSRVIKSGGLLLAAVPAMPALWGPQDKKLGHFKRYMKDDFGKLFEKDFEILKLSYFNSLLFLPVFILRKLFNLFPAILKERDELDINNKFVNYILYKIFHSEAFLLKHIDFPFGVSVLAVARKK